MDRCLHDPLALFSFVCEELKEKPAWAQALSLSFISRLFSLLPPPPYIRSFVSFLLSLYIYFTLLYFIELRISYFYFHLNYSLQQGFDLRLPVRRPTMLHFRSRILSLLRTLLLAPLYITTILDESETLEIELAQNIFDNSTDPYTWAAVALSAPGLQVYEATLELHAHMTGIT